MSLKRERTEKDNNDENGSKKQCFTVTVEEHAKENPDAVCLLLVQCVGEEDSGTFSHNVYMNAKHLAFYFCLVQKHSDHHRSFSYPPGFLYHLLTNKIMCSNLRKIRSSSEEELQELFGDDYEEYDLHCDLLKKVLKEIPEDDSFLDGPVIKVEDLADSLMFKNENKEQCGFIGFNTYILFYEGMM
jgi:hypothetical protein